MHSLGFRVNALLTLGVLALMGVLASFSDNLNVPAPSANVQVSLWDVIIPSKEWAKFSIYTTKKYRFVDQGSNLRGKEFNLNLHWHVMPKTGKMFADKIVMTGYRMPKKYR